MYGRALYGGNPFDPPGTGGRDGDDSFPSDGLVTSDGKTLNKDSWGALPTGMLEEGEASEEEDEEESSNDEMEDSDEEEEVEVEDGEERPGDGLDSVLPPPANLQSSTAPVDLRKQAGDETPFDAPPPHKQLYQVIEQRSVKPHMLCLVPLVLLAVGLFWLPKLQKEPRASSPRPCLPGRRPSENARQRMMRKTIWVRTLNSSLVIIYIDPILASC
jgi:hypothetical protein